MLLVQGVQPYSNFSFDINQNKRTWHFLYNNNAKEKVLMVPISQTQDPHGSFKVTYPTSYRFQKTLDF